MQLLNHVAIHLLLLRLLAGCDQSPPHTPDQASLQQAWKRADDAVSSISESQQQASHERRLRDIDRLRTEAQIADLQIRNTVLGSFAAAATLALIGALLWLSAEIRRRRVLTLALSQIPLQQETTHDPEST